MQNSNLQNIFLRSATIGLLDSLNSDFAIELWRNDEVESHTVPIFYNMGNDEGFLRDFFTTLPASCMGSKSDVNYEKVPRGIVTMSNFSILSHNFTNKFIRGNYFTQERDENGQRASVGRSARIFSLPLAINYDLKFETSDMNQLLKIIDELLTDFYKSKVFHFQFKGIRIAAQYFISDNPQLVKPYSFSFGDGQDRKGSINLSVEVRTHFPSFDKTSDTRMDKKVDHVLSKLSDRSGSIYREDHVNGTDSASDSAQ